MLASLTWELDRRLFVRSLVSKPVCANTQGLYRILCVFFSPFLFIIRRDWLTFLVQQLVFLHRQVTLVNKLVLECSFPCVFFCLSKEKNSGLLQQRLCVSVSVYVSVCVRPQALSPACRVSIRFNPGLDGWQRCCRASCQIRTGCSDCRRTDAEMEALGAAGRPRAQPNLSQC